MFFPCRLVITLLGFDLFETSSFHSFLNLASSFSKSAAVSEAIAAESLEGIISEFSAGFM